MIPVDYDLFSRAFKRDPFPTFAHMRQHAPIYRHVAPNGIAIWYITRYEDVAAVLKDERFVKDIFNALPPADWGQIPHTDTLLQLINRNMLFADPPDHTRLRALVSQAFTPRRVAQMAPRIQAIAHALLDRVAARGEMDLIEAYAYPLPLTVIMEMLGIPAADQEEMRFWSQAIIAAGSHGISYRQRKQRIRALVDYLGRTFAARRVQPEDDLITALVQAEQAGDRLTETELSSMAVLLLVTGHETTVNLIGNGAHTLLTHPPQRALAQANPAILETAVDELLRFDGPVETSTTRWAREDVLFRGHLIQRGDVVRVVLASANRDPAQFDHPDVCDLRREDNRHLAFGLGIHYCLGAPLARLEGQIALQTLLARFPDVRLAAPADLTWRSGVLFRGLKRLPLVWSQTAAH
ncbi:MAG: cytochrome P450 [Anaerolineales bacterium]|nr:cytochrome P450 [Anaerolineales bacterium]MCB8952632.1 cytochrome P450 [Ardenticatenales bacterium]